MTIANPVPPARNQGVSMSAKKRRDRRGKPNARQETRAAEVITVLWALTVMTAFGCDVGLALARWLARSHPDARRLALLSELLLGAAVIIGAVALVLTPVVIRVRRRPPPRSFLFFAILTASAPLAALLLLSTAGR